ncbi:hypothetical protein ILUMI_15410 [Ignelater luminosus]|uniref:HTH psq-type domain-containing protein n=1 Tax=Ignelater luminosus TaxID=2038154 RepID=A0A8K0CU59_IGNLU|nr:hypothetical protein ILUMI_15410 [Ignelater luminosus]
MSTYKRKSEKELVVVMKEIRNKLENGFSKKGIARDMRIAKSTLRKRFKCGTIPTPLGRFTTVFSPEKDKQLALYVEEMDKRFNGVTHPGLMTFDYEFAEANKIKHCFNEVRKKASRTWTAYNVVSNIGKAKKGFEATGIWPYNPEKFTQEDFAPSLVIDKEIPQETEAMASEVVISEEDTLV